MVVNISSKARALGATLREETESHGYSLRGLGKKIGRDVSTISRWFDGSRKIEPTDVARILAVLGVSGEKYDQILALAYNTDASVWFPVTLPEQRHFMEALLRFERDASRIIEVAPLTVPGLLQTEAYIRVIMPAGGVPANEIESRVRIRQGRQRVLESAPLLVIIGEAALRQQVGGPGVLADQLRYLISVVRDGRYDVDLRVVPYAAGWTPLSEGGWMAFEFPDGAPTVVQLDNRKSGLFLHERLDVALYLDAVDAVMVSALGPEESVDHMARILDQLEAV
jgi:transcriptional regulator with XRE-family HTH domain